jgi:hypothetical protein
MTPPTTQSERLPLELLRDRLAHTADLAELAAVLAALVQWTPLTPRDVIGHLHAALVEYLRASAHRGPIGPPGAHQREPR